MPWLLWLAFYDLMTLKPTYGILHQARGMFVKQRANGFRRIILFRKPCTSSCNDQVWETPPVAPCCHLSLDRKYIVGHDLSVAHAPLIAATLIEGVYQSRACFIG